MTTATPKNKTTRAKSTAAGRSLIAAMSQVRSAIRSGDPLRGMTVREVKIAAPKEYDAAAVRELRQTLGVSVAVFAQLLGVSVKLVEHWQSGKRDPSSLARRLLDRIADDPAVYLHVLIQRRDPAA